jgi:hypothetical protein
VELTAIKGGTVIDCTGGPPTSDGAVVIEGERIRAAGPADNVDVPTGARIVDASGKYLLPGLIDMHVHYRSWQGELFLAAGVTTIKDLGNPVEWISKLARMQEAGTLRGPRIFYVGNNIDSAPPSVDHAMTVANDAEADRAVRGLHRLGVVAIKVRQNLTPALLRTVTVSAQSLGLSVSGHLGRMTGVEAARAGIDGLEHATGVALAVADDPDDLNTGAKGIHAYLEDLRGFALMDRGKGDSKEAELIQLLIERDVKVIATISIRRPAVGYGDAAGAFDNSRFATDPALGYIPEAIRKAWVEGSLDKRIQAAFSTEELALMKDGYRRLERFIRRFHNAGGVVIAGTDTLNDPAGATLQRELRCLVEAGLKPMDALITATRDAARFLGQNGLGTIEPGKTADLVILGGNPLDDIGNLAKVERVYQAGREVDTRFHADYCLPEDRPTLARPLWIEREIGLQG